MHGRDPLGQIPFELGPVGRRGVGARERRRQSFRDLSKRSVDDRRGGQWHGRASHRAVAELPCGERYCRSRASS